MAERPVPQVIRDDEILLALEKVPLECREVVLMAGVEEFPTRKLPRPWTVPQREGESLPARRSLVSPVLKRMSI